MQALVVYDLGTCEKPSVLTIKALELLEGFGGRESFNDLGKQS
jgi:hypothetical protein